MEVSSDVHQYDAGSRIKKARSFSLIAYIANRILGTIHYGEIKGTIEQVLLAEIILSKPERLSEQLLGWRSPLYSVLRLN